MLKKTITYENLDGEKVTEDFWFQITKSEVIERALAEGEEKYALMLKQLEVEKDGAKIIAVFKDILGSAVGRREGQLFIKSDEIRNRFMFSGAYDVFFTDLILGGDSGAAVLSAMLPKDAQEAVEEELRKRGIKTDISASPPILEGTVADAEVQASKPQPDTFPTNLERAVQMTSAESKVTDVVTQPAGESKDDEPLWLKEGRYATPKELMLMGPEETRLAMKMKSQQAFG